MKVGVKSYAVSFSLLLGLVLYLTIITTAPTSPRTWSYHGRGHMKVDPYRTCEVPPSGFKAWQSGVVTTLQPVLERNCSRVLAGHTEETGRIGEQSRTWKNALSDEELLNKTRNCSWVIDYFQGNMYVTKLERSFPIAYTLVIHNSPQQILRLLRFLYRPINMYCIHPDGKSSPVLLGIFYNIASCLNNVIIPPWLENVAYTQKDTTIINAQMNCLTQLLLARFDQPEDKKWNYVINLCGKELPLASTHNIAQRLQKLNGSSVMYAFRPDDRFSVTRLKNQKIPYNLTYYKSATYMALSYQFVLYLQTNLTAISVRQFFRRCSVPEEHYYPTLYMSPGVPGNYNSSLKKAYFRVTNSYWFGHSAVHCHGRVVHGICIVNSADLKSILKDSHDGKRSIFHNKYFMEDDHTIMDCAEERIVKMNKQEFVEDCGHINVPLLPVE